METILLGDRYELLEQIGEGGMANVYKAKDRKLDRFVAVKVLKKEFVNNDDIINKFKREATAIANLHDANIVNVLDVGGQEDINYIVMEYVNGPTLKDLIKQKGRLTYDKAITIALQVAKALDCAHKNNIVHRDIKPQNILVAEDGSIKVTDFGIAKSANASTIVNTTNIIGSAHYFSPEQAKGNFLDSRTDLYSLGVVMYEMVTGRLPFDADSPVSVALKHIQEEIVPPKNINSSIPDSFNKLILKSMEKEQIKRYQTAKELINDLQKVKNDPNALIGSPQSSQDDFTRVMAPVNVDSVNSKKPQSYDKKPQSYNKKPQSYNSRNQDDDYDFEDGGNKKKKKTKVGIILGLIFALILVSAGIGTYYLTKGNLGKTNVAVPAGLINLSKEDAEAKLTAVGLIMDIGGQEQSDKAAGTVLSVSPNEGSVVAKGYHVRVIISAGSSTVKAPDLTGLNIEDAKKYLTNQGFQIGNVTYEFSDTVPKDQVIKQTPAKDASIAKGDKFDLTVSKGTEVKFAVVPVVIGKNEGAAVSALSGAKLKANVIYQDTDQKSQDGIVISSNIAEGVSVKEGTTVNIYVGKYKEPDNGGGLGMNNKKKYVADSK
ncbi:MAG: Stk1 family PASTA domain-containing Ser/Thr kinase [Clostridiaceae bacterium]